MANYIVSFTLFTGYLLLEKWILQKESKYHVLFYGTFELVGICGLIFVNYSNIKLFEYFFLLSTIFPIIKLYSIFKANN